MKIQVMHDARGTILGFAVLNQNGPKRVSISSPEGHFVSEVAAPDPGADAKPGDIGHLKQLARHYRIAGHPDVPHLERRAPQAE